LEVGGGSGRGLLVFGLLVPAAALVVLAAVLAAAVVWSSRLQMARPWLVQELVATAVRALLLLLLDLLLLLWAQL
jgi:hypothetical protein